MINLLESFTWASGKDQTIEERPLCTDYCDTVAWIATVLCVLGSICLFAPEWLQAESAAKLTATQSKSLSLNEQGVAAASEQDFRKAEKLLRESLAVDDGNISAAINLASVLLASEKNEEALTLLEKYKEASDTDPGLFKLLGDAYFSKRDLPKALSAYNTAVTKSPKDAALHSKIATIYSLQNNLELSEKHFDIALKNDPSNGALYGNLASIKLANGKLDEAIAHAKRSIQISPSQEVYLTLGTAYEMQNELKNSLIAFERARDLGNESDELEDKIDEIKDRL